LERLKIGFPTLPYQARLCYAYLKLIDLEKADVRLTSEGVEVEAKGQDVRPVLADAFEYAIELAQDYASRGLRVPFPFSGNDRGPLRQLLGKLGLKGDVSLIDAMQVYVERLRRGAYSIQELQDSLWPFSSTNGFSPFQVFLLELYALTRGPFFTGKKKHGQKLNLHQIMILTGGYLAARHIGYRIVRNERKLTIATLVLPLSLRVMKYDFYRNLRDNVKELPGVKPEEAVELWMAINMPVDFPEDILLLGIVEPVGTQQAEPEFSISVYLEELRLRAGERLSKLKEERIKGKVLHLLRTSLKRSVTPQKAARPSRVEDDALEYVKLLYNALQGSERDRLELELRASRREATVVGDETAKERYEIARIAREIAHTLRPV
jgi:hypothetical protein